MKQIKEYMERYGLTQAQFGRRVGVSQPLVAQWISGFKPITPERAVQIERKTKGEIAREDLLPKIFKRSEKDQRAVEQ